MMDGTVIKVRSNKRGLAGVLAPGSDLTCSDDGDDNGPDPCEGEDRYTQPCSDLDHDDEKGVGCIGRSWHDNCTLGEGGSA